MIYEYFLSVKFRLILSSVLVFGAALILFAFIIDRGMRNAEIAKLDARLESHADKVATELEENQGNPVYPDTSTLMDLHTEGLESVHLRLFDTTGKILIGDSLLSIIPEMHWREALNGPSQKEIVRLRHHNYRVFWMRAEVNDRYPFVIELAAPMTGVHETLEDLHVLFSIIIPLAILLIALAVWYIARAAFRPVNSMIETARSISAQNLDRRLALPKSRDEVRRLGETLNDMIDRIDRAFKSQKQFIADASHEIRTPLTIITTELEYAGQRATDTEVKESIQTSLAEIDRLARLADNLLLLARLDMSQAPLIVESETMFDEQGKPQGVRATTVGVYRFEDIRLDELILEAVGRVRSVAAKKQIVFNVHIEEAVEFVGDREKLMTVVLNLLDNAVKYSPEHTAVDISLECDQAEPKHVRIVVADQGMGIPEQEIPNIFKRFYRVDPSRSGVAGIGLGLAIVERLVAHHQGTVSVKSNVGKGSVFTVELPIQPQKKAG